MEDRRRAGEDVQAGEAFYEPPGVLHAVSRNASNDARAKLVVFMVADATQPTTVVEGEKK